MKKSDVILFVVLAFLSLNFLAGCQSNEPASPGPASTATATSTYTETHTMTDTETCTPTFTPEMTSTVTNTYTYTPTGTVTPTFTSTPTSSPCVLMGITEQSEVMALATNHRTYFKKYTIPGGTVTKMHFYVSVTGYYAVAVYNDGAAGPGTKACGFGYGVFQLVSSTGWVEIDISDTALAAGDYWLAICCDNAQGTVGGDGNFTDTTYWDIDAGLPADYGGTLPPYTMANGLSMYAGCD